MDRNPCEADHYDDIFELELSQSRGQQYSKSSQPRSVWDALPDEGHLPGKAYQSHAACELQKILSCCLTVDGPERQVGIRCALSRPQALAGYVPSLLAVWVWQSLINTG